MDITRRNFVYLAAGTGLAQSAGDALRPWKSGVTIRPVSSVAGRHTIHSYFNTCPESPDGKFVLYYTSSTPEGHSGELRIQERATGKETVLVRGLDCEDAHRVACQQWLSGGRRVLFHDMRRGEVVAASVDVSTGKETVLARGRMVSWGQPNSDWAPIYGVHFQPGEYTGAELLNVATGEIRTLITAAEVRSAYPAEVERLYGKKQISTPFGTLSPNGKLIFFKLSAVADDYIPRAKGQLRWPRSYQSSREGLVGFDIEAKRPLFFRPAWGHPAWDPSSKRFINHPNIMIDAKTGVDTAIPNLPKFSGQHPSVSPDSRLFVTDTQLEAFGVQRATGESRCATRMEPTGSCSQSSGAPKARPRGGRIILTQCSAPTESASTTT